MKTLKLGKRWNLSFKKKKKKKNARMEQILFQWMQFYSGVPA